MIATLTLNAAISLKSSLMARRLDDDGRVELGRVHTGLGKWTTLAALGVISNLKKAGAVEANGRVLVLTHEGQRLAERLAADWDSATAGARWR